MDTSKKKHEEHEHDSPFEGFTIEEIENNFKELAHELKSGKGQSISEIYDNLDEDEEESTLPPTPYFRNYNPSIHDFLARAKTEQECLEIIEYCLQKSDITPEEAEQLKDRLKKGGPKAFGSREWGFYTSHT